MHLLWSIMCVKVIIVTPSIVSAAAGVPLGTVPLPSHILPHHPSLCPGHYEKMRMHCVVGV